MIRFIFLLMLIVVPCAAQAQERPLQIDIAENHVDITTGFDGANVVVFGMTDIGNANISIMLRGPESTVVMRRKEKILGAWISSDSVRYRRVPSYFDYVSTMTQRELSENPALRTDGRMGVDYLGYYTDNADEDDPQTMQFRDAMIAEMRKKNFYPVGPGPLTFMSPRFFKATFKLPPGVPTGVYTVEAVLIRDDAITARESRTLQVGQVGFNARVYLFAQNHSFFYGVFAVLMALVSGWSAFTFLRRD